MTPEDKDNIPGASHTPSSIAGEQNEFVVEALENPEMLKSRIDEIQKKYGSHTKIITEEGLEELIPPEIISQEEASKYVACITKLIDIRDSFGDNERIKFDANIGKINFSEEVNYTAHEDTRSGELQSITIDGENITVNFKSNEDIIKLQYNIAIFFIMEGGLSFYKPRKRR